MGGRVSVRRVCEGEMERMGSSGPRSGACPGCHPWPPRGPLSSPAPAHPSSRPLRSCLPSARGAPLLAGRPPLFCWFLGRGAGGQVRRLRETPPGAGSPRSGSGRMTPGPLPARAALAASGGRPAPERQVASVAVAARHCHAEPRVAKLVGCSRVTCGSSPGARSCRNFDLQIDFPLKGSEAFPVLIRVVAELGIPNSLLENDQAQGSGRGGALSPSSLCIVLVLVWRCPSFPL